MNIENPEKKKFNVKEYQKKYRKLNKEKIDKQKKESYEKRKCEIKERNKIKDYCDLCDKYYLACNKTHHLRTKMHIRCIKITNTQRMQVPNKITLKVIDKNGIEHEINPRIEYVETGLEKLTSDNILNLLKK